MRALILGASGQVGKRLTLACRARGIASTGAGFSRATQSGPVLNIAHRDVVHSLISSVSPTTIFLCAALTAVDYCETHPEEARRINVEGVRNVADACRAAGIALVFLSTDYVFDGRGGPYSESDLVSPESVYAQTKLEGEKIVLDVPRSIVARTSVVYDWDPQSLNFAMQMIKRLKEKQPSRIVSDQWSHPTLARNLADVLLELAEKNVEGLFHVVGADYVSRYDFAVKLARTFEFDQTLLTPILTKELNPPAARPLQSDLKTDKVRKFIQTPLLGIDSGLQLVYADYLSAEV